VHFSLGYPYWEQRRYDDAEHQFEQELLSNPQSSQALAYLGDVLMKKGHAAPAARKIARNGRRPAHCPRRFGKSYTKGGSNTRKQRPSFVRR